MGSISSVKPSVSNQQTPLSLPMSNSGPFSTPAFPPLLPPCVLFSPLMASPLPFPSLLWGLPHGAGSEADRFYTPNLTKLSLILLS